MSIRLPGLYFCACFDWCCAARHRGGSRQRRRERVQSRADEHRQRPHAAAGKYDCAAAACGQPVDRGGLCRRARHGRWHWGVGAVGGTGWRTGKRQRRTGTNYGHYGETASRDGFAGFSGTPALRRIEPAEPRSVYWGRAQRAMSFPTSTMRAAASSPGRTASRRLLGARSRRRWCQRQGRLWRLRRLDHPEASGFFRTAAAANPVSGNRIRALATSATGRKYL